MQKMTNKLLSIVMIIALILTIFSVPVAATEIVASGTCGTNVLWELNDEGTLFIKGSGVIADFTQHTFPKYYQKKDLILTAVIGENITRLGNRSFYDLPNLETIVFAENSKLTSIGDGTFLECSNLRSINIPDTVTTIGEDAFYDCSALESVAISPNSHLTSIGNDAFLRCNAISSIYIPEKINTIGSTAFYDCSALTSINVDENNGNYSSCNGILFNKDKTILIQYPANKQETAYSIPTTVLKIEPDAFFNNKNILEINISENVNSIGQYAFCGCEKLSSITFAENCSVETINMFTFGHCYSLTEVTIPMSVKSIERYAFAYCENLQNVSFATGCLLTRIGEGVFMDCKNINEIHLPNKVTQIDSVAFYGCTSLTEISIPVSTTKIDTNAFFNCNVLQNIYYGSIKKDWDLIKISSGNEALLAGTVHYYCEHKNTQNTISIAPTCSSIGCTAGIYCRDCEKYISGHSAIEIDADAHKWDDGTITTTATCKVSGVKTYTCRYNASHKKTENLGVNASYHLNTKNTEAVASTCSEVGYTVGVYCNDCEKYISGHTEIGIDVNAHKWDNGSITTTATCKVSGVKTYTCQHNASHKKTENLGINASNHVNTKNVAEVKATCTTKGYTAGVYCNDCQKYISGHAEIAINPANHMNTKKMPETPATFENVGYTAGVYCNDCKKYISGHVEIPKLVPEFTDSKDAKESGNNIISNNGLTVAQLLSQAGKGAVIKTTDGKSVENATLIGTGMVLTMADGSKKEIVVYGDVDGDGKISAADARQALRASVGLEKFKEDSAKYKAAKRGSVDKLSAADARLILRASVGLEDPKAWMK